MCEMIDLQSIINPVDYLSYKTESLMQRVGVNLSGSKMAGVRHTGFSEKVYEVTIDGIIRALGWHYDIKPTAIEVYNELIKLQYKIEPHWQSYGKTAVYAEWVKPNPLDKASMMWYFGD